MMLNLPVHICEILAKKNTGEGGEGEGGRSDG